MLRPRIHSAEVAEGGTLPKLHAYPPASVLSDPEEDSFAVEEIE